MKEYKVIHVGSGQNPEATLNSMAAKGWVLCQTIISDGWTTYYIFERERQW